VEFTEAASAHNSLLACLLLCLVTTVLLTGLVAWHVYLVCTGHTTIELMANRDMGIPASKHIYNLGVRRNIQAVFGTRYPLWLVPFVPNFERIGDGFTFEHRNDFDFERQKI